MKDILIPTGTIAETNKVCDILMIDYGLEHWSQHRPSHVEGHHWGVILRITRHDGSKKLTPYIALSSKPTLPGKFIIMKDLHAAVGVMRLQK